MRYRAWARRFRIGGLLAIVLGAGLVIVDSPWNGARRIGSLSQALFAIGVLALVGAGVMAFRSRHADWRGAPLAIGWYDDPKDRRLLRYHDGTGWTDRTAAKGNRPRA